MKELRLRPIARESFQANTKTCCFSRFFSTWSLAQSILRSHKAMHFLFWYCVYNRVHTVVFMMDIANDLRVRYVRDAYDTGSGSAKAQDKGWGVA